MPRQLRIRGDAVAEYGWHMDVPDAWIEAVGWQYEVAHTAVLSTVLAHPEAGAALAGALLGSNVKAVTNITRERAEQRTRADLRAFVSVDGRERSVAVETKVDSYADRAQLARSQTDPDGLGLLLAVGLAGLRMCVYDCQRVSRETGVAWRFCGAEGWSAALATVISATSGLPSYLHDYCAVALEQGHKVTDARKRMRDGGQISDRRLDSCAWLAELRERVDDDGCQWAASWVNGEVLHSGVSNCWRADSAPLDLYLQVVVRGDGLRSLMLRAGSAPNARFLRALKGDRRLGDTARDAGLQPVIREIRDPTRSCQIANLDLSDHSPAEACSVIEHVWSTLDPVAREAVNAAARSSP